MQQSATILPIRSVPPVEVISPEEKLLLDLLAEIFVNSIIPTA